VEIQPNVSFCSILKELHDVKEELKEYKEERNAKRRCIDVDETEGGGDTSTTPAVNNNDDMEDRKIAARTTTASATVCGNPLDHQETVTGESSEAAEASHAATDETSGTSVTSVNESDTAVPSAAAPNSDGTAIDAATCVASIPAEDTTDPVACSDFQRAIARSILLDQEREVYQSAIAQSLGLDRAARTSPQQQDASPEGDVSLAVQLAISRSTGQDDEGTPDGSGSAQDPLVILEHDDAEKDLQLDIQRAIRESLKG